MASTVECPVFYPDMLIAFNHALLITNKEERNLQIKELNQHYSNLNWVTDGLSDEISYAFPTNTDIDVISNNKRDMSKFKEKLAKFVITGRYFASPIQFAQVLKILCSKWACQVSHINCSIRCHYAEPNYKYKLHPDLVKRCKTFSSKPNFNCHFCIRYSLPGLIKQRDDPAWKPRIMYKVCSAISNSSCLCTNPINFSTCCSLLMLYS